MVPLILTSNFDKVLNLIVSGVTVGGGMWLLIGGVILASGLKDKNGPQIQSGIWQLVGGAIILALAVLFKNLGSITTDDTATEATTEIINFLTRI